MDAAPQARGELMSTERHGAARHAAGGAARLLQGCAGSATPCAHRL
jgi:hypothetical protein